MTTTLIFLEQVTETIQIDGNYFGSNIFFLNNIILYTRLESKLKTDVHDAGLQGH